MGYLKRELESVFLYEEPSSEKLDLKELKKYLKEKLPEIDISIRKNFISYYLRKKEFERFAKELARIRVRDITSSSTNIEPFYGEIQYEKNLLADKGAKASVLYDGFRLCKLFSSLIPQEERALRYCHIVFTNRLFGTFDENDKRYHARVIICATPSLISTTGIVEAPAKPKEFYKLKNKYAMLGLQIPLELIKQKFSGRFIDYDDERLTEVMKGYALQALFYNLIFQPFCSNKKCRLFNAHWQEEVIEAQLKGNKLCKKHEKVLSSFK